MKHIITILYSAIGLACLILSLTFAHEGRWEDFIFFLVAAFVSAVCIVGRPTEDDDI